MPHLMSRWFALGIWLTGTFSAAAETVSIPGTGDGVEILQAMAARFGQTDSDTKVDFPPSIGSGGGIAAVSDGRARVGRIARALTPEELTAGLTALPVMRIPAAIFVHPSTGVTGMTFAQLAGIYSGAIVNWSEIGGADLKVRVVRRESEDSTLKILRASMPGWRDLLITPRSKTAVTTQDAVQSVKETEGAVGFGPYSSAISKGLTILAVEGHDPTSDTYPSSVSVSFVFKTAEPHANVEGFLKFARSEPGRSLIRDLGAIPWSD